MRLRQLVATASAAGVLTAAMAGVGAPAQAAPVVTGGLVDVTVTDVDLLDDADVDVLNDLLNRNRVNVGVVAQIAATLCDVNAGGILGQLRDTGTATCETAEGTTFDLAQAAG